MSEDQDFTESVDQAETDVTAGETDSVTIEAVTTVLAGEQVGGFDVDGDGTFDIAVTQLPSGEVLQLFDSDGDGRIDAVDVDIDADGISEVRVFTTPEGYVFLYDGNGDGVFEDKTPVTREYLESGWPGVAQFLDAQFEAAPEPAPVPTTTQSADVEGGEHWFRQAGNGYCVPASVSQLISEYTGVHFSDESQVVALAYELGVWTEGDGPENGMTDAQALQLLEAAGVPATLAYGESLATLDDLRESGHVVMVAVDSGEYWYGEPVEDNAGGDHMVVVEDVDEERGVVVLNDPGHPDGQLLEVPIDVFADAWADSDNAMILSDEPAPEDPQVEDSPLVEYTDAFGWEQLPDAAAEPAQLAAVVGYASEHPWALLPVTLPGDAVHAAELGAGRRPG